MNISSYFSVCMQLECHLFTRHRQRQAQFLIASRSHNTKKNNFMAVNKKFKPEWQKRRFWVRPGRTDVWWQNVVENIVIPSESKISERLGKVFTNCVTN